MHRQDATAPAARTPVEPRDESVKPKLSIIIPAYNEQRRIRRTLERIREYVTQSGHACEVLVVDDGSDDGTSAAVRRFCATLAAADQSGAEQSGTPFRTKMRVSDRNHGKGHAVRRGMLEAEGDLLLMCDADLSAPIEEIEKLLPWLERGYDVVIGSRDMRDSRLDPPQPLLRRLMAWVFRTIRRRLLLPEIRDTQCGFKLFRRDAARAIFERQTVDGWLFDCEVLGLADRLGYRIREVGVTWSDDRDSRVRPVRYAWRAMRELWAIRRRLRNIGVSGG